MPVLPGSVDVQLESLAELLRGVERCQGRLDAEFSWSRDGDRTTVRAVVARLGPVGLLERQEHGAVRVSSGASQWLDSGRHLDLIAVLHANVRFLGEILVEIGGEGLTHNDLLEIANDRYNLGWRTLDQLRRRTTWLRGAGFVDLRFDGRLVLTDDGLGAASALVVAEPADLPHVTQPEADVRVDPPSAPVAALLAPLDMQQLAGRRAAFGYVPRGTDGDILSSLRELVQACDPTSRRRAFDAFCLDRYGIKSSSASAALGTLIRSGLVEQTAVDTFAATAAGSQWLDAADDLELVRIMHSRLACIGEVLVALDHADRAPALATHLAEEYGMPREDVAGVRSRLQLLLSCGLIEESAFARFRVTPLGAAFRETLPLLQPSAAVRAAVPSPRPDNDDAVALRLSDELVDASTDSDHPDRLERAVRDAFLHLGAHAEHLGGRGRTDVLVTVWQSGGQRVRAIVDAKAASSGTVDEGRINFDTLREHKEQHEAGRIAVVGPSFSGGRLTEWALQHDVALIDARFLSECVRQHQGPGVRAQDVADLLRGDGTGPRSVRDWWSRTRQQDELLSRVIALLSRELREPDEVTSGALSLDQIYLVLRNEMEPRPRPSDIEHALAMLSSPLVAAVMKRGSQYVMTEHPSTVSRRFRALAGAAHLAADSR